MKTLIEDVGTMGGVSAVSAIIGSVAGWWRGRAIKRASLAETVNEAVESLIGNLRQDCADARKAARDLQAEHRHCREQLVRMNRRLDELMAQSAQTEPLQLPRPIPGLRKPRGRK